MLASCSVAESMRFVTKHPVILLGDTYLRGVMVPTLMVYWSYTHPRIESVVGGKYYVKRSRAKVRFEVSVKQRNRNIGPNIKATLFKMLNSKTTFKLTNPMT